MALVMEYRFELAGGAWWHHCVTLDPRTLELQARVPAPPAWAALLPGRCTHCPLDPAREAWCPAATALAGPVTAAQALPSHDEVRVEVRTPWRTVSARTTVQRGLASLFGVVLAASGCPHTRFLRPMARFHLPFATEEETIYRAAGTYLLSQYFRACAGARPDLSLAGLAGLYADLQRVNASLARRLRRACANDAAANAIVLLDLYAKALPASIEEALGELAPLFVSPGGNPRTG